MNEQQHSVRVTLRDQTVVVNVSGYWNEEAGKSVLEQVLAHVKVGKKCVVIDFSATKLLNSRAVGTLLDMVITITEDFLGRVILTQASPLMNEIFEVSGVNQMTESAPDMATALEQAARGA